MKQIVQMILHRRALRERVALAPRHVPQRPDLRLRGMTRSELRRHAFQHLAQRMQLDDLLLVKLADRETPRASPSQQAVGKQSLQRVAHWRSAHTQPCGDRSLPNWIAGTQNTLEDQGSQIFVRRFDVRSAPVACEAAFH